MFPKELVKKRTKISQIMVKSIEQNQRTISFTICAHI